MPDEPMDDMRGEPSESDDDEEDGEAEHIEMQSYEEEQTSPSYIGGFRCLKHVTVKQIQPQKPIFLKKTRAGIVALTAAQQKSMLAHSARIVAELKKSFPSLSEACLVPYVGDAWHENEKPREFKKDMRAKTKAQKKAMPPLKEDGKADFVESDAKDGPIKL